jgi:SAM-dependent methyltransferase
VAQSDEYVMGGLEAGAESRRLSLLEATRDPATVRRLEALGVERGWRCLEVGAGHGSIARWLADKVGPDGSVVALDIDTRFLTELPPNVEVRVLDIRETGVEPGVYDLAHCRALLMHLPDPAGALARMAAALAPGGVLLAEEGDYGLYHYGGHPEAEEISRTARDVLDAMTHAGIVNASFGRRLPGMLSSAGLKLLGAHVDTGVSRPGDPGYEFTRQTVMDSAPRLIEAGLLDTAGPSRLESFWGKPGTVITGPSLVAAWAQKPNDGVHP